MVSEGEFSKSQEVHSYTVSLDPGDKLSFSIIPVGAYLRIEARLLEPTGEIIITTTGTHGQKVDLESETLSGRGTYTVQVRNYSKAHNHSGRAGLYEFRLSCKKRNGTVIAPTKK